VGSKLLWEAIQRCYTHNPKLRPTARSIADYLGTAHSTLLRVEERHRQ
jgi:hypothetical protein